MQAIIDKLFPNMSSEEQWTEILALFGMLWFPVLLAAGGFMLGPIFTQYNNNPEFPGKAHYSLEGAGIGLVVGFVISVSLYFGRLRARRWEAAHHAHDHTATSPTVTDLDPEALGDDTYL